MSIEVSLARTRDVLRRSAAEIDVPRGWFEDTLATATIDTRSVVPGGRFRRDRVVDASTSYPLIADTAVSQPNNTRVIWTTADTRSSGNPLEQALAAAKLVSLSEATARGAGPGVDWPIAVLTLPGRRSPSQQRFGLVPLATAAPGAATTDGATPTRLTLQRLHPDLDAVVTSHTEFVFSDRMGGLRGELVDIDLAVADATVGHTALRDAPNVLRPAGVGR